MATSCIKCAGSKTDKLPPNTPFTFAASDGRNDGKVQKSRKNKVNLFCEQDVRVLMCKIHLHVLRSSTEGYNTSTEAVHWLALHCML